MITSINEICKVKKVEVKTTIYSKSNSNMLDFKIVSGDFYEIKKNQNGESIIKYKNCVEVMDFPMISKILPQLSNINFSIRDNMPYFTSGLENIAGELRTGGKIAVEGGPCLFGTDEVTVEIVMKNRKKEYFDYNTGKAYLGQEDAGNETDLAEYVSANSDLIDNIHFINKKKGITPQEFAFIKYPFEIASALSAPLVIPIPDMSYVKYLKSVLSTVDESIKKSALEEFKIVEYEISDMYIKLIDEMCAIYKNVHCDIVHARNKELCKKYYEKRAEHIERNKVIRTLTSIPEKLESIKDYISMPALPYYLYGIDNVIEVDSMDETDSYRKCRQAHKGKLNLACILFPELLSSDNEHTIFDAPQSIKEYGNYKF